MPGQISPTILRRVLNNVSVYEHIEDIKRASKIIIVSPTTNSGSLRIAVSKNPADSEFAVMQAGDDFVFEDTVGGETLSMDLFALPSVANDTIELVIWR